MSFSHNLVHHPRRLFLRRALFQIHLWMGVLLSLYIAVIGLSGSILVWEDELRAHALHDLPRITDGTIVAPQQIFTSVSARYPGETVTYFMWPQLGSPVYTVYLRDATHDRHIVQVNAGNGELLPATQRLFVDWVHELHVYLLLGKTGFTINCLAGAGLLLLTVTGAALWWPGTRLWLRGLRISWRHKWKRINYDLHSAIGIWTLLIVSMWGVTAIDFLFPEATLNTVNVLFPVVNMRPPVLPATTKSPVPQGTATIATIAAKANQLSPRGQLSGILFPVEKTGNIVAYVDTARPGDYTHRDIHTFSAGGALLTTWHYGQNQTVGDWIIWLINPVHFGTVWGTPFKLLWSTLGLSLPILSLTGLILYWNRYLGKRWRSLRSG